MLARSRPATLPWEASSPAPTSVAEPPGPGRAGAQEQGDQLRIGERFDAAAREQFPGTVFAGADHRASVRLLRRRRDGAEADPVAQGAAPRALRSQPWSR